MKFYNVINRWKWLALVLFIFFPLKLEAQPDAIKVGDKVKIISSLYDYRIVTGWVDEMSPFGIRISDGNEQITLSYHSIESIKVKNGQKTRWRLGMGLGIIPGAIVGALTMNKRCNADVDPCFMDLTDLENALKIMTGAVIGMGFGALIGSEFTTDNWQRVSLGFTLNNLDTNRNLDSFSFGPSVTMRIPLNR